MVVEFMNENNCLKIGMKAPDFIAQTTFGPLRLSDFRGKWVILFSHPAEFTPVCTYRIHCFGKAIQFF